MSKAKDIRILDLANPEVTPAIAQMRATASANPPVMTREAVLTAGREIAGLDDFGSMDFVERLDVMLEAVLEDNELNDAGRKMIFDNLAGHAANRLLVEDMIRRNPDILAQDIRAPIIVCGLPRSGTTHLVNLIAADDRLRSMAYWESLRPVPAIADRVEPGERDPRLMRAKALCDGVDHLLPYQKNVHELTPQHAHEEIELEALDFSSYLLEWYCRPDKWRDYYLAHDETPHYEYIKKVLKILQWQRGPHRWVLKSPQHLEQLRPLSEVFPDATVVITHRDPVAVIASCVTMNAYRERLSRDLVRPEKTAEYWVDRIRRLIDACMRDHGCIAPERLVDLRFSDFMANQREALATVFERAGLPMTARAAARLNDYIAHHGRGRHGRVIYDLAADFGLSAQQLSSYFTAYYEKFGLRPEFM